MYPDSNQTPNQNQYSIDYLNQIAPQPKKQGMNNRWFIMIIIGGLVLAIIVGVLTLLNSGGGPKDDMQRLKARLQTLQSIVADSQKTIKSGPLRGTNSNLSIFLTNTNRDIDAPLETNGIKIKQLDKKIVAEEANEKLIQRLEDARLNAVFDRVYAREMSYQLDTVAALMKKIYNSTKSKSLKEFLDTSNTSLLPIKTQFSDFNAANG